MHFVSVRIVHLNPFFCPPVCCPPRYCSNIGANLEMLTTTQEPNFSSSYACLLLGCVHILPAVRSGAFDIRVVVVTFECVPSFSSYPIEIPKSIVFHCLLFTFLPLMAPKKESDVKEETAAVCAPSPGKFLWSHNPLNIHHGSSHA